MAIQDFLIRIEGVNFDATIADTNDLSTIRGGSLALLSLGEAVSEVLPEARMVMSGASQSLFRLRRDGDPAAVGAEVRAIVERRFAGGGRQVRSELDGSTPPFSQLTVVVDVVPDGPDAIDRLEALNHARQLRRWTVAPLAFARADGNRADPFDGVRPASVPVHLPPGKVLSLEDDGGGRAVSLSASVAARRAYGRRARQLFYRRELPATWRARLGAEEGADIGTRKTLYSFTNSTEDIVAEPPPGVPTSLATKIAVVYADGNAFGALRAKLGAEAFGDALSALRRDLLDRTLRWFTESEAAREASPFVVWDRASKTYGLRLETLLWGGDEMMFVLPSWLAVDFVRGILETTRSWSIDGHRLTHAIGVAVAHHKTPIRQLQSIARASADLAKDAGLRGVDSVTYDIFESLAPPDIGLGTARARVFLTSDDWKGHLDLARSLALTDADHSDVIVAIERAKGIEGDAVPRSQLYGALRKLRAVWGAGDYRRPDVTQIVDEHFEDYARRMGISHEALVARIPRFEISQDRRSLAFDVAMTTVLWDYVHPLADRLPIFPTEKA